MREASPLIGLPDARPRHGLRLLNMRAMRKSPFFRTVTVLQCKKEGEFVMCFIAGIVFLGVMALVFFCGAYVFAFVGNGDLTIFGGLLFAALGIAYLIFNSSNKK